MVKNPPEGCQRIIPYLGYDDANAAIEFLCKAFGFEERWRLAMPDGRIGHAELGLHDNVLMVASAFEEMGFMGQGSLAGHSAQVMCYVDDVDAHFERAKKAGATILETPTDQFYGDRSYRAVDLEGHRWGFATHKRDVSPEEMKKAL